MNGVGHLPGCSSVCTLSEILLGVHKSWELAQRGLLCFSKCPNNVITPREVLTRFSDNSRSRQLVHEAGRSASSYNQLCFGPCAAKKLMWNKSLKCRRGAKWSGIKLDCWNSLQIHSSSIKKFESWWMLVLSLYLVSCSLSEISEQVCWPAQSLRVFEGSVPCSREPWQSFGNALAPVLLVSPRNPIR